MKTWKQWLKETGVPYIGQDPGGGSGGWMGAPSHGHLRSVGDVKIKKRKKHGRKKTK